MDCENCIPPCPQQDGRDEISALRDDQERALAFLYGMILLYISSVGTGMDLKVAQAKMLSSAGNLAIAARDYGFTLAQIKKAYQDFHDRAALRSAICNKQT